MASAGTVTVDFAAEVAKFNAQLKTVQASLTRLETNVAAVGKAFELAFRFISTAALIGFAKQAIDAADAIGDAAQRAGTTVEAFSRLKFAAEQNDITFGSLEIALRKFQDTLGEAGQGTQSAVDAFRSLGLAAQDLKGIGIEEQLGIIADRFRQIKDPADQTRIAIDLFGRSGNELVPLLNRGSEGLAELSAKATELGLVLDTQTSKAVDAAKKKLEELIFQAEIAAAQIIDIFTIISEGVRGPEIGTGIQDRTRAANEAGLQFLKDAAKVQQDAAVSFQAFNAQLAASLQPPTIDIEKTDAELKQLRDLEFNSLVLGLQERDAKLHEAAQLELDIKQQTIEEGTALAVRGLEDTIRFDEQRFQSAQATEQAIQQLRAQTTDLTIGLFQALGAKNKVFAAVAIALETALAVKRILLANQVAAELAFASQLVPGDPSSLARALAAKAAVLAAGRLNAALAIATGAVQIGNALSSGGNALGSPGNPIFSRQAANDSSVAGATGQRVVNITINGPIAGPAASAWLLESIKDAIDNTDAIIISPGSLNGQVLAGG